VAVDPSGNVLVTGYTASKGGSPAGSTRPATAAPTTPSSSISALPVANYSAGCVDTEVVSLTAPAVASVGGRKWLFLYWLLDGPAGCYVSP